MARNFVIVLIIVLSIYHKVSCQDKTVISSNPSKVKEQLNIALITAGALRSFVYTFKSWETNIFDQYPQVKIFAHILASNSNCSIYTEGLKLLRNRATVLELGDPNTPLIAPLSVAKIKAEVHPRVQSFAIENSQNSNHQKGNIIDMYDRRARAYELAIKYGVKNQILWDLVIFIRLDIAIYSPNLDLYHYYKKLVDYKQSNNIQTVISHKGCNFKGYCDRILIGLKESTDKIFVIF